MMQEGVTLAATIVTMCVRHGPYAWMDSAQIITCPHSHHA